MRILTISFIHADKILNSRNRILDLIDYFLLGRRIYDTVYFCSVQTAGDLFRRKLLIQRNDDSRAVCRCKISYIPLITCLCQDRNTGSQSAKMGKTCTHRLYGLVILLEGIMLIISALHLLIVKKRLISIQFHALFEHIAQIFNMTDFIQRNIFHNSTLNLLYSPYLVYQKSLFATHFEGF